MKKTTSSVVVLALMLGLAACGSKTEQTAGAIANDTADFMADAGNATSNMLDSAREAVMPTPTGQEFADRAAKSDAFEIAAAKLAMSHAASDDVKAFARDMTKAHTESTAKIKAAAGKASPAITPQAALTSDQDAKLADLGKLNGADFDRRYMTDQVEAHEDALSLMNDYAAKGEVAPLKTAAAEIAPIVQQHLDRARALSR